MQVIVAGAGVVGLAIGRALARAGHEVIVVEATDAIGSVTSSRNSEVIHGGMYYPSASLKSRLCVDGRRALYAFCAEHGVPHRRCGKLIVATDDAETAKIEAIHAQGLANGVEGLSLIDGAAARRLEPALACTAALVSAETGIIDSHAYMLALLGDLEDAGGMLARETAVTRLAPAPGGRWRVTIGPAETVEVDAVVNSAGLDAVDLARRTEGFAPSALPRLHLAKGNYFTCTRRNVFSRLVYPAPVDGGLGVHVTLDLAGRMRFGPDVEWIERIDYAVDPRRAAGFSAAIRRYWPGLPDDALVPDYAGIRPKLSGPGEPAADFVIAGPGDHGLARHVALFGIESPGLTASLAIADRVAALVG